MHGVVEGRVQVAGEDYLVGAHESRASGGFAASVSGCPGNDDGVHVVIAQDRIQISLEEGVEFVFQDTVFELTLAWLEHVRIHLETGLAPPKNAVFGNGWELAQHQSSVGRTVV